ncbi:MAG TPA: hypothetical protein PK511_03605 [Chitinophagales bacterium]|nr:hypothetical protein [Chitinophagales bacterium]HMU68970.1 hypothetical protein [Chitinophagales bacterium]HMX03714.1 hypothetical protein [Chitinophagales bacterium]HMZ88445.1 hypothetical protein [Chitinophagales bacterium]HNF69203.1 hypothetical protein [Chitinophagales bacterium]
MRIRRYVPANQLIYSSLGLAFILCIFASCSDSKDPVIAYTKSMYVLNKDEEELRSVTDYDSIDRIIAEYIIGRKGRDTVEKSTYVYGDDGLIRNTTFSNDKITHQQFYVYAGSMLMQMIETDGHDTIGITDYVYYPTGKIKRTVLQLVYDKSSPTIIVTNYNRHGDKETMYKQIYEDSSRLVLSRYEMDKFISTYDSSEKMIRNIDQFFLGYYEEADTTLDVSYQYDDAGRLIVERNAKRIDTSVPDSIFYFYNAAGLLQEKLVFTSSAHHREKVVTTDRVQYDYDKNGRLIKEYSFYYKTGRRYSYRAK